MGLDKPPAQDQRVVPVSMLRVSGETVEPREDILVKEWPLTIYLNGQELVTLLTSPEYIEDLAVGFLSAEGFLQKPEDVTTVRADYDQGQVFVESRVSLLAEKTFMKRYITTGCGKGTTFYDVTDSRRTRNLEGTNLRVKANRLVALMKEMQGLSVLYKQTGGVHSAALCDQERVLVYREDIGRHNATDKIMGKCFREEITLEDKLLLTSGRISSEILLKVAKMGIAVIVSRSAPTDLAVRLAREIGMTVVGFVRGQRLNVYTHSQRIVETEEFVLEETRD